MSETLAEDRVFLDRRRTRAALATAGLSRRALAQRWGLHPDTIARWTRGAVPIPVSRLRQLAALLDVRPGWLLRDGGGR